MIDKLNQGYLLRYVNDLWCLYIVSFVDDSNFIIEEDRGGVSNFTLQSIISLISHYVDEVKNV